MKNIIDKILGIRITVKSIVLIAVGVAIAVIINTVM